MPNRPPSTPDPERLPDSVAARLLERASELDVAHKAGSAVVDLRAAAAEAGISAPAFDAALAELQAREKPPLPDVAVMPRRGPPRRVLTAAVVAIVAVVAVTVFRTRVPEGEAAVPGAPMVEEAIQLRCLSAGDAAALVRPLLGLRSNTIVVQPQAPHVITIRATLAQLQNVKSVLEKSEVTGATACASQVPPR